MTTNSSPLTQDLINRLIQESTTEARCDAARQVAFAFETGLTKSERAIAEDIFRFMVKDADTRVRAALSDALKHSRILPTDIAVSIAKDLEISVASPMLKCSELISDEVLLEIISTYKAGHQIAIAERENLSPSLSHRLVMTGDQKVVETLLYNKGSKISLNSYGQILRQYGQSDAIHTAMVDRDNLPVTITEQLITLISDELCTTLIEKQQLAPDLARQLMKEARENSTANLIDDVGPFYDVQGLVNQLYENNRLTPALIIRAACLGDMSFLENALACLCQIPVENACELIRDPGDTGLRRLLKKAGMPLESFEVIKIAVNISEQNQFDSNTRRREAFVESAIEEYLNDPDDQVDSDNLELLMQKLQNTAGSG